VLGDGCRISVDGQKKEIVPKMSVTAYSSAQPQVPAPYR
jgi:hypothetical protein